MDVSRSWVQVIMEAQSSSGDPDCDWYWIHDDLEVMLLLETNLTKTWNDLYLCGTRRGS
jgi:hypothetical protein